MSVRGVEHEVDPHDVMTAWQHGFSGGDGFVEGLIWSSRSPPTTPN
jgi:hypothetical protein